MSTQKLDITRTLELADAIEVIAIFGVKVAADGKVNYEDLPTLMEFMGEIDSFLSVFESVPEIVEEIQDIDQAEIMILLNKFLGIARNIRDTNSLS